MNIGLKTNMYIYESYVNVVDLRSNTPKTNSNKLELRPKNLIIVLGSIMNIIGRNKCDHSICKRTFTLLQTI